jgi:ribosome-binding factor A
VRKNSIKNTRINGEVQRELSQIIRGEIKDPRIALMTSVTGAEVAPDLKTCKVYISVLGDQQAKDDTIAGLHSAEGYIRRLLAKNLNLRNTPELTFLLDQSIEYGVHMAHIIDEVRSKEIANEAQRDIPSEEAGVEEGPNGEDDAAEDAEMTPDAAEDGEEES